jgi:hypothetical protein
MRSNTMSDTLIIDLNQVIANIEKWAERKEQGLLLLSDSFAKGELTSYAKLNRRWQDRTSSARNGLHGGAYKKGKNIHTYIAHRVSYGVYLEKCNQGRYAILMPTLRANKIMYNKYISKFINS